MHNIGAKLRTASKHTLFFLNNINYLYVVQRLAMMATCVEQWATAGGDKQFLKGLASACPFLFKKNVGPHA